MHPINNKYFGIDGIAVKYYNGSATANGYIVKQTGTNKFNVTTNGTAVYPCIMANTLASAGTLGVDSVSSLNQMTILIAGQSGTEHVAHIYSKQVDTLEGNKYPWSLTFSVDGSYVIEAYDDVGATYGAGAAGGPTTLTFATAPATGVTHGTASHPVVVASSPVAPVSDIMELYLTTSAAALPTTGGTVNSSYTNGSFGFTVTYASAGTYYAVAVLSDTSYLISSALVIA